MKKILITDMSSTVGFYLKQKFYETYEIYDLGCDIRDSDKVEARLNQIQPSYIFHLCQQFGLKNRYEQDYFGTKTYQGTVNLIQAAKKLHSLELLTFHSVYHEQDSLWDYSKFLCEKIFEHEGLNHSLPYCVLQLPTIYGNYIRPALFNIGQPIADNVTFRTEDKNFEIEQIIFEFRNRRKVFINKDKRYKLLFVDDLIEYYDHILANLPDYTKTINQVPFANEESLQSIIKHLKLIMHNGQPIEVEIQNHLSNEEYISVPVKNDSWKPKTDIKGGLDILVKRINQFDKEQNGL